MAAAKTEETAKMSVAAAESANTIINAETNTSVTSVAATIKTGGSQRRPYARGRVSHDRPRGWQPRR